MVPGSNCKCAKTSQWWIAVEITRPSKTQEVSTNLPFYFSKVQVMEEPSCGLGHSYTSTHLWALSGVQIHSHTTFMFLSLKHCVSGKGGEASPIQKLDLIPCQKSLVFPQSQNTAIFCFSSMFFLLTFLLLSLPPAPHPFPAHLNLSKRFLLPGSETSFISVIFRSRWIPPTYVSRVPSLLPSWSWHF